MRNFVFGVIPYCGYLNCAHFDPEQENLIHFSTEGLDTINSNHKDYLSTTME